MPPTKTKALLISGLLILCAICHSIPSISQSGIDSLIEKFNPSNFANAFAKKATRLEERLVKKSIQSFSKLQRREAKVYRKMLHSKDSLYARQSLLTLEEKYQTMRDKLKYPGVGIPVRLYIPRLDSLKTSLKFLRENGYGEKVKDAISKGGSLQIKLDKSEEIRQFIRERRDLLKDRLESLGFLKQLKKFNKEVYYYSAKVREYTDILKDSKKRERMALELLSKTKSFQDFMQKNSLFASLFRIPGDPNDPAYLASLAGLQTRAQVTGLIQGQIAAGGPNGGAMVQQNFQQAQSQLNQLKSKVLQAGGGSSDDEIPEFKPNNEKTKSFWNRLEYGTNIQNQRSTSFLPVTSDLGLSLGYKLNNTSIIGIGASYKMGWGRGWNNIKFTTQGFGIRSFLDFKLKGSLWISGGFEKNYRPDLSEIALPQAIPINPWQQSGLIGLSKSVPIKSKFFKKTKLQLLWDFLSYEQVPRAQPIVFRIGYNLK